MTPFAKREYEIWINSLQAGELRSLLEKASENELEDAFYRELEFGTAGLRGILGAGTNRMNLPVVARATQGLSDCIIQDNAQQRGVCIGYDSRNMSAEFAQCAADVLSSRGIKVFIFNSLRSVPQLSFTLRNLGCVAGIMITASHNPAAYNGYKVYWEDGGQIGPELAARIMKCIEAHPYFGESAMRRNEIITTLTEADDEPYYEATSSLLTYKDLIRSNGSEFSIVYTPLHGAGYIPVTTLLCRAGITNLHVVKEQIVPDGNFPTVKVPNPEDPGAYRLAIELAKKTDSDCILATDPDSDRLGVAVRKPDGEFMLLTGNQIGAILIKHILSTRESMGTLPNDGIVVKSIVSTWLADAICAKYGVECVSVPTGFRFISQIIEQCSQANGNEFLFGFEESCGFLSGGFARDKDAVLASLLICEVCVCCLDKGITLYDYLQDIYKEYGYYMERTVAYSFEGKEGMEKIASIMKGFLENPPHSIAERRVTSVEDYTTLRGKNDCGEFDIACEKMSMGRLICEENRLVCVRPSGTEPKIKFYVGVRGDSMDAAEALAEAAHSELKERTL